MPIAVGINDQICTSCPCKRAYGLTRKKKKNPPPFYSNVKRDVKIGLHPDLRALPPESPAVGTYDPVLSKRPCSAINWDLELESEEFSKTMGGNIPENYIVQRRLMKTGRGPGTHEVVRWPEICLEKCVGTLNNTGFTTERRFHRDFKSATPAPGYTPVNIHDPYYFLDKKKLEKNRMPSFLFDTKPRFIHVEKDWFLPCNIYNKEKYQSITSVLKHSTGKRGPYDIFTGPRDETSVTGYFAPPEKLKSVYWPFKLSGEIEKLLHKSNDFKGKWTDCPRFVRKPVTRLALANISLCYKNPEDPGPGRYDPGEPSRPKTKGNYPFDSSVEHVRPFTPSVILPGPGHYMIREKKNSGNKGFSWMFKSRVPRLSM